MRVWACQKSTAFALMTGNKVDSSEILESSLIFFSLICITQQRRSPESFCEPLMMLTWSFLGTKKREEKKVPQVRGTCSALQLCTRKSSGSPAGLCVLSRSDFAPTDFISPGRFLPESEVQGLMNGTHLLRLTAVSQHLGGHRPSPLVGHQIQKQVHRLGGFKIKSR